MSEADEIKAAHPTRTNRHDLYAEAMRLVGERHAKAELVELVNWLLFKLDKTQENVMEYKPFHDAYFR